MMSSSPPRNTLLSSPVPRRRPRRSATAARSPSRTPPRRQGAIHVHQPAKMFVMDLDDDNDDTTRQPSSTRSLDPDLLISRHSDRSTKSAPKENSSRSSTQRKPVKRVTWASENFTSIIVAQEE